MYLRGNFQLAASFWRRKEKTAWLFRMECLRDWLLTHLSQSAEGIYHTLYLWVAENKKELGSMGLLQRTFSIIDRGQYSSVTFPFREKRRVWNMCPRLWLFRTKKVASLLREVTGKDLIEDVGSSFTHASYLFRNYWMT